MTSKAIYQLMINDNDVFKAKDCVTSMKYHLSHKIHVDGKILII